MAVMAQWLSKTWEVSASKITALTGISTGLALETETNDDADGSPSTNIRGYAARSLPLSMKYGIAAGTPDVRGEYESWEALVGAYAPFYLAGRRLGAKKYLLTQVSASDIVLSNAGRWIECTVSITLEEYAAEASGDKGTVTGQSLSSAVAVSTASAAANASSALKVGASTADKAARKVSTL